MLGQQVWPQLGVHLGPFKIHLVRSPEGQALCWVKLGDTDESDLGPALQGLPGWWEPQYLGQHVLWWR